VSPAAPSQLALDLGHRAALGAGDFFVAGPNMDAVAWLDRWPNWQAPGLFIHGPPGCGKSHLVEVWSARSDALRLFAADIEGPDPACILGEARAVAIDDIGHGGDETTLFHLYNMIVERGGSMLLTGDGPVAGLEISLADLRSRIASLPAVAVKHPDDLLLAAVMVKLFADRQITVSDDVINFLLARGQRSFDAARRTVARLDERALELGRRITVPLAREILSSDFDLQSTKGDS
jgi:chromosomal replication initiation ATPase DnaA